MADRIGRLLLVEDDEANLLTLSALLEDEGWQVTEARSGEEALQVFESSQAEIVVCDLNMPGIGGFEVLNALHRIDSELPVIILSGDGGVETVLDAVRRGAFDYIVKQGNLIDPLMLAAMRALAHSRMRRDNQRLQLELERANEALALRLQELDDRNHALALARDHALAASRAKSSFLANRSHERRTPLNVILGYAALVHEMAEDKGYGDILAELKHVAGAGEHLLSLIQDVLDLARIEAGQVTMMPGETDLRLLLIELGTLFEELAEQRSNVLEVIVPADAVVVMTDSARLRQILTNLLSNACKFTERGRITLELEKRPDYALLRVQDTGIGMSPENLQRVFEEFVQADEHTHQQYGGSGLGLAISRTLAAMLGVSLRVKSCEGEGTTFSLEVPPSLPMPVRGDFRQKSASVSD